VPGRAAGPPDGSGNQDGLGRPADPRSRRSVRPNDRQGEDSGRPGAVFRAGLLGGVRVIYLATPYSHPDPAVMEARFEQACKIAGELLVSGQVVFSPIAHTHPIAVRCELPRGWDFWERYDREMVAAASKIVVVMMPGWEKSKGIAGEIAIARELRIP